MFKRLLNNIKEQPIFFGLYAVFLLVMAYFVFNYHKTESTILVNQTWTDFQDSFFKYTTYVGDGWFAILAVLGLLAWRMKYGVIAAISFVGSAGVTQFFKRVIYDDVQRPFMELWNEYYYGELHLSLPIEEMKKSNSFPSGHTTSAFSVFCILALLIGKKWWGGVCLVLAALIGYSRIYLSQHFFEDVFVGSMIGTMGALLVYTWLKDKKFGDWGDLPLVEFIKNLVQKPNGYAYVLGALGLIFFIPFLGSVHLFDWDEINFAESSREMLVTGNFFQVQVNYEPFMEKPPFFFWLQSLSMSAFGVNEFAARFPNAIIGVIALIVLFSIGKRLHNNKFGVIWALVYLGSFLPHLYYKSGIIDPAFNLFIFTSIYFLVRLINGETEKEKNKFSILSGLFIGLAIVTKGPVGLLLLMLTFFTYWAISRFKRVASLKHVGLFILTILLTTSMWYGYEIAQNGPWFLIEFIKYQIELFSQPVAGHEQPFYYHFIVVLIGCFPLSIFALPWIGRRKEKDNFEFEKWMTILFWVVMILFTIVSTKIVHYSSMAYLPLSYLAAKFLFSIHKKELNVKKWMLIVVGFFGFIFSTLLTLTPLVFMNKDSWLLPNIDDPFAQYQLDVEFSFMGWEFMIGIVYFAAIIYSLVILSKQQVIKSMFIFAISTGVCLSLFLKTVVPQVEKVSQLPQIEFLEEHAEEDAYITVVAMKSYAHFFYGKVMPLEETDGLYQYKQALLDEFGVGSFNDLTQKEKASFNTQVEKWHYEGPIDKPTYLILRAHQDGMSNYPECEFLYRKGGYTFYKRMPK